MDYSLRLIITLTVVQLKGLNPYSNGLLSETLYLFTGFGDTSVLILILMDYSLSLNVAEAWVNGQVLILILMDYSLSQGIHLWGI